MQGDFRGNVADDDRNAVTWGVFPGQEIIQTTIIERESFLSWKVCAYYCTYDLLLTFLGRGVLDLVGMGLVL